MSEQFKLLKAEALPPIIADLESTVAGYRDQAAGYVNDIVAEKEVPITATRDGMESIEFPAGMLALQTLGSSTIGDGQPGLFQRVNSEPSSGGKVRSVDRFTATGGSTPDPTNGGWWAFAPLYISPGEQSLTADQRSQVRKNLGLGSDSGELGYVAGSLKNTVYDDVHSPLNAYERARGSKDAPENVNTASVVGKDTWAAWINGAFRYCARSTWFVEARDLANNWVSALWRINMTDIATGADWIAFEFKRGRLGIGDEKTLSPRPPECALDVAGTASFRARAHERRAQRTPVDGVLDVTGESYVIVLGGTQTITDIVSSDPYCLDVKIEAQTGTVTFEHNTNKLRCIDATNKQVVALQGHINFTRAVAGGAVWSHGG